MQLDSIKELAKDIRREIIISSYKTGRIGVHIGPALSLVDFLAVLYGDKLNRDRNNPYDINRDRFILSKGHAYAALYATLALKGFFSIDELESNFMSDGGLYPAHPIKQIDKGIECSTGSLGMGLSFAVGKALNAKKKGLSYTTYVAMGDGECNEGSTFEAFTAAAQFHLDNLVIFIDHNRFQQDGITDSIIDINFHNYLSSIGCNVSEINGNDIESIIHALESRKYDNKPYVIIGNTIKGKGISFMENNNQWHHSHMSQEQFDSAIKELE